MSNQSEATAKKMPLAGMKVIELGTLIAGPYAASLLAQFGAEVIKIESPGNGDPLRNWRKLHHGTSLWWYSQSRNKKSMTLDLRAPEGQQIVRDLVKTADIVIENFRPGTLEKWGLGWEQLKQINPALVMVRVSGYGQTGPYKDRPGFAAIAESMGGLRSLAGYPDRPPVRVGVSIGDTLASLYGVIGALMAMYHLKVNQGEGQFIDVALYEAVFGVMESLIPEFSAFDFVRERSGASLPGIAPSNTYLCADGHYIIIAGNSDSIYKRLMHAIGRSDLADDPSLAHNEGRVQQVDMLDQAITDWTTRHPLEDALAILDKAEVPSGRIYTAKDISSDPHYEAREMLEPHTLPNGDVVHFSGIVPKLSGTPGQTHWLGPQLGEHTDQILHDLGYAQERIAALHEQGVI
ncbi:crotonobetainyl-CoA:carnitine CoA-transferase CaiB-like acyl-CoA transferase [Polynucleobacter sphagniphilus]|jgi:formyl-CoA transferase|uniref:CaiB/BaiF CoA transferase family protein n=1 Tax=Polynucleobacter sphagniphilus TaxID=1743169 RepID=UPI0024068555|nr:CaiB/BaiF CoA-transferase family protein [Polynucleobacter sphagniphilus]MDF9788999.1 crotonobetainyl-CoA:carnitine CoA-transferase CaiB-like acyl-CoA transferase [Polynucleobacter sphagniphilus]MDH6241516.1 crotonobetainyl-CoA:carnitine CoA-transferase CaiB-like acyl-CoA transferase [Polynucleobacter sphagniphilus]MDH6249367.1 crotonobetainyl-CoA:carnitine CoA-transferase CaiB-like acyl-CoA transferase [Polynucleobacter sphagniphilus]MDH6300681.1 crotonobetainyl-CoA:carnitine CoA-transferas